MQPNRNSSPVWRGVAVASVGLGFWSLLVFWWYPYALIISSIGFLLGATCLLLKVRGGLHGENLALVGATLCSISAGVIITVTQVLHAVMWWDK